MSLWLWNPKYQKEFIILFPLYLDSRSKTELHRLSHHLGRLSPSIWLFHIYVISSTSSHVCPHTTSCETLVDNNQTNLHLSVSFSPSALPSSAMDLCWTSTSASAGEDSTIQAEWRSMALKVGYKSLCDIKIHIAASCQIKTLNLSKTSFWDLRKKPKNNLFFQLTATHFVWDSSYVFWTCILGFVRLWNLNLQSKDFDCSYCGNVYYVSILSSSGSHRWRLNHRPVGL